MKKFAIIIAMDEARGIGKAGGLAWHLPPDLRHFKEITSAVSGPMKKNAILMGRKTWESLPLKFRPLPGRLNVVLTRQEDFILPAGVLRFFNLDQSIEHLDQQPDVEHIFCIGGAQLCAQAINHPGCYQIFATCLEGKFDCDVFFPPFPKRFQPAMIGPLLKEKGQAYRFIEYIL